MHTLYVHEKVCVCVDGWVDLIDRKGDSGAVDKSDKDPKMKNERKKSSN